MTRSQEPISREQRRDIGAVAVRERSRRGGAQSLCPLGLYVESARKMKASISQRFPWSVIRSAFRRRQWLRISLVVVAGAAPAVIGGALLWPSVFDLVNAALKMVLIALPVLAAVHSLGRKLGGNRAQRPQSPILPCEMPANFRKCDPFHRSLINHLRLLPAAILRSDRQYSGLRGPLCLAQSEFLS